VRIKLEAYTEPEVDDSNIPREIGQESHHRHLHVASRHAGGAKALAPSRHVVVNPAHQVLGARIRRLDFVSEV
jgi:hypothetical protein